MDGCSHIGNEWWVLGRVVCRGLCNEHDDSRIYNTQGGDKDVDTTLSIGNISDCHCGNFFALFSLVESNIFGIPNSHFIQKLV